MMKDIVAEVLIVKPLSVRDVQSLELEAEMSALRIKTWELKLEKRFCFE